MQNSVGSSAMKGALLAIMKRVKHRDEHIQLQALAVSGGEVGGLQWYCARLICLPVNFIQLLESCVSNCGNSFRAEMSDNQVLADLTEVAKGVSRSDACQVTCIVLHGQQMLPPLGTAQQCCVRTHARPHVQLGVRVWPRVWLCCCPPTQGQPQRSRFAVPLFCGEGWGQLRPPELFPT